MTGYVVDAKFIVKWLVKEVWSDEASTLLEVGATLIAPEVLFAEVRNALWAMRRRGDFGAEDLADATEALRVAPVGVPFSMRQLAAATRLPIDLDHPVYDCFYLALAVQEQYPVVTADTRFHEKVRGHPYLSDRITHMATMG